MVCCGGIVLVLLKKINNFVKSSCIKYISLVEFIFAVLLLYVYLLVVEAYFPEGINNDFVTEIKPSLIYLILYLLLSLALIPSLYLGIKSYQFHPLKNINASDFIIVLLPLTPIIQYIILNQDTLSLYGLFYLLVISLVAAILVVISIPALLSIFASRILFMSLGTALLFILLHMPTLAQNYSWHKNGEIHIQLTVFLLVFFGLLFLYKLNDKFLKIMIVFFFISNSLITFSTSLNKYKPSQEKK